ncbi:MAG TPA: DUF6093 family protein [Jiangellaceae bacterium]
MSREAALADGRRIAEEGMTSRCTVRRKTDQTTDHPDLGEVPVWVDVYTDLPLKVAGFSRGQSQSRHVTTGGVEYEIAMRTDHFPALTTDLRDNDLVDVTSGDNTGLVQRLVETDWQDQATAQRFPVVSVPRPEEWS